MNIFIGGIGGVGMGAIALLARDCGYTVRGSDASQSLTTHELEHAGINISYEQTADSLRKAHEAQPIDWYLHTAAMPADHPELIAAKQLGITTSKRDAFIQNIIKTHDLQLLAVAGTHGKTTTSAMLVWALQQLKIPATYLLGSQISWGASGHYEPGSRYFVYECDEFDRNFLQFHPELSVITSIEYDHPDTYPTEAEYKAAFRDFLNQSNASILWQKDADWLESYASDAWELQEDEVLSLQLVGEHNRRNGTLVAKSLERLNITSASDSLDKINSFPGVQRRFEQVAENLYTDYGHTPTEIAATLQLAHELSDHVVLVYQPHQNVRQHEVKDQYTKAIFKDADEVYWLPTYLSREDATLEILSPETLTQQVEHAHIADLDDNLWDTIQDARESGKLVLCMGAGSIDGWLRSHL